MLAVGISTDHRIVASKFDFKFALGVFSCLFSMPFFPQYLPFPYGILIDKNNRPFFPSSINQEYQRKSSTQIPCLVSVQYSST